MKAMDEAQLVEIGKGDIMANMRNYHLNGTARAIAISTDGGDNFGDIYYDQTLVDPICAASIIRDYKDDMLYFSNAAHPTNRIRMTVKRSSDFGKSWEKELLVYEGPSAYSDMIDLDSNEYLMIPIKILNNNAKQNIITISIKVIVIFIFLFVHMDLENLLYTVHHVYKLVYHQHR